MTKLVVTPIDMAARGSYAERKRLLRVIAKVQGAQANERVADIADGFDVLESLLTAHLETDDGTPVGEALEQLSANEFDRLVGGLVGQETIPNPKSAP